MSNTKRKSVLLATDGSVDVRMSALADRLNQACKHLRFDAYTSTIDLGREQISFPHTYNKIGKTTESLRRRHSLVLIATELRYDNNYFWESDGAVVILSFFGWSHLTNLPKSNGMVEFISSMLAQALDPDAQRHENTTGCVYDFMWDKRGIDARMRSGTMCRDCYSKVKDKVRIQPTARISAFNCTTSEGLEDLIILMDETSHASKREIDILTRWETKAGVPQAFDVFLCHNSQDKSSVRELYRELVNRGIKPWFDEEHLRPGAPWQRELERTIPEIRSVAVVVGQYGQGPWQDVELDAFLREFARRGCPVIPVLLKDAGTAPNLPLFLQAFTWVDFRKKEPDPWRRLLWGVTGEKPT